MKSPIVLRLKRDFYATLKAALLVPRLLSGNPKDGTPSRSPGRWLKQPFEVTRSEINWS